MKSYGIHNFNFFSGFYYDVESLKNELELRFAEEQEQTTFTHAQQLQAAKMELNRALDLIRQKVLHLYL